MHKHGMNALDYNPVWESFRAAAVACNNQGVCTTCVVLLLSELTGLYMLFVPFSLFLLFIYFKILGF